MVAFSEVVAARRHRSPCHGDALSGADLGAATSEESPLARTAARAWASSLWVGLSKMTTPAVVVSSTVAHQRMDRLRDLFAQIEREFGELIEENAERALPCDASESNSLSAKATDGPWYSCAATKARGSSIKAGH